MLVNPGRNVSAALMAIKSMNETIAATDAARSARDAAIVAMHDEDNMTPPAIARALGEHVSVSTVRLVLRIAHGPANRGDCASRLWTTPSSSRSGSDN